MAYRSRGRSSRSRRAPARSSGRRTYSRRSTASRRGYRSGGSGGRTQTLKLVIQQAPADGGGYTPGVPGTVGVAALGAKRKSTF